MARSADPERQATRAIRSITSLGTPRHGNRDDNRVHSVGTMRTYRQAFKTTAMWLNERYGVQLYGASREQIREYLDERADQVGTKHLNNERRCLELYYRERYKSADFRVDRVQSRIAREQTARAYSPQQVAYLTARMSPRMSLSTRLTSAGGLRASELYSLRRIEERVPAQHRDWSQHRFIGREDWARYTVDGKGGLVREVRLPQALARELEMHRLDEPKVVRDRDVRIESHYDVSGGRNFSNAFSRDSKRHLDWSAGAHGLRHSYAQLRMDEIADRGASHDEARKIVSQELGHFRPDIRDVYVR